MKESRFFVISHMVLQELLRVKQNGAKRTQTGDKSAATRRIRLRKKSQKQQLIQRQ